MCGIAGIVSRAGGASVPLVRAMTQSLEHRGPDDHGVEVLEDGRVVLGHRRLAIQDLSPLGHQPMASTDRRVWTIFNGEIYNFGEIRRDLEALGSSFRSHSDTEVILEAYRHWGLSALNRFRGMFAIALWDCDHKLLHLCRDRFGVKPLYYLQNPERVAFSSELRALNVQGLSSRQPDPLAVTEFLQFGYVDASRSILADVHAVPPGGVVTFDLALQPKRHTYWLAADLYQSDAAQALRSELSALPEEALLDRIEDALAEAFRYRMVADVPVGLFLSGGIDSSIVATLLARRSNVSLRTFTIGFGDSEFDEAPYAREVARRLGAHHTEHVLSGTEAIDIVDRLPQIADEPIGDSSLIPTYLVSRMARQHVTVALSADGADELFGGYARYAVCARRERAQNALNRAFYFLSAEAIERLPQSWLAGLYSLRTNRAGYAGINDKLRKFVRMSRARTSFSAYEAAVSEWPREDVVRLLRMSGVVPDTARNAYAMVRADYPENTFMHFDLVRYLPGDLLTKVDRASMAVSLEAREPFLDHEMAKLAAALPLSWKIRDGQNKYALRRILARHLPAKLFDRPKRGFSVPIGEWLRGPLRSLLIDELSEARVRSVGLLDPAAVTHVVDDFLSYGRHSSPAGIWFLLQLQQWAGRWTTVASPSLAA